MGDDFVLMDWADAMRAVQDGLTVHRNSWSDAQARVALVDDQLVIWMQGEWRPWLITREDITAQDWEV